MAKRSVEGVITSIKHVGKTGLGNPIFDVYMVTTDGAIEHLLTKANSSAAQEIENLRIFDIEKNFYRLGLTHADRIEYVTRIA